MQGIARTMQPKPVTRAIPIHLVAHNATDHTITLAIAGIRYEYWLNPIACDIVNHLARRVSLGKALAYAKRHATHCERL